MSLHWNAIRYEGISIFSPPIRTIRWRGVSAQLSPRAGKRSLGGTHAVSTRHRPTGRICAAIRADRTSPTPIAASPISPLRLSRPRCSPRSTMTSRRRPKTRSCISVGRCWSLTIRTMDSHRRHRRRCSSCRRHHRISLCWRRRRPYSRRLCCRSQIMCRCRHIIARRPTWRRRRRTSSTTTFTIRWWSTTRPIWSRSPGRVARRRR